jgi:hypothetical protein
MKTALIISGLFSYVGDWIAEIADAFAEISKMLQVKDTSSPYSTSAVVYNKPMSDEPEKEIPEGEDKPEDEEIA